MFTRQEVLLSVGAVHFVVVGTAITEKLAPHVRIIIKTEVCGTIDQTCMYGLLVFILGAKWC